VEDVVGFALDVFVVAEAMIEKVALPGDGMAFGEGAFPEADDFGEDLVGWEADEQVDVIGHEGEVAMPVVKFVVDAMESRMAGPR
jgi:hypothetical protein